MLALYIVAEVKRPRPLDWTVSLSKEDKNPYGGYIIYRQLKDLFPIASIQSYRTPVYNQVNNANTNNAAYILIDAQLLMSEQDVAELLNYTRSGNYAFLSAFQFSKTLMDTLHFSTMHRFDLVSKDSVTINFKNPHVQSPENYGFKRMTLEGYISKFDTANVLVLGNNQFNDANFIKLPYGKGAFFIHVLPLCFSNYFMMTRNNAEYPAKALSYLPRNINKVLWDEYYKLGQGGSQNPLRFILTNRFLRWAFWIGLTTMVLFILFEMKRRQRIIPLIEPLRNSTLDFVCTVGNVYYNQRNNKNICLKKVSYLMEFIRSHFHLSTSTLNDEFVEALSKKSDLTPADANKLIDLILQVQHDEAVSDETVLELNKQVDQFYKRVQ